MTPGSRGARLHGRRVPSGGSSRHQRPLPCPMGRTVAGLACTLLAIALVAGPAEARVDHRAVNGFGVGHCRRASCFARHPHGTFVYPRHHSRAHGG